MTGDGEEGPARSTAPVIYPDIRKILKSLAADTLEIHCHSITLTQCRGENPEIIRGRGGYQESQERIL